MADARPFHWEFQPEEVDREVFRIEGGRRLEGSVSISGAKNAALKLMAAATLTGERCRFTNVPEIEDVRVLAEVLQDIGVTVDHPEPNVYEVAGGDAEWLFVPLEAAAKMRASFILLGPLLTRFGRVIISNPGGDRIGRRPVNLHVDAMRALGAEIEYRNGYYFAKSPGRLRGGRVNFPQITVMGTENAMLAATLAVGHTIIEPAAREPEVDDLIAFLVDMGAEVERTAPNRIEVEGRRRLRGAQHAVVSDRIEAGTFVFAAAVTRGNVLVRDCLPEHLDAVVAKLRAAGVEVTPEDGGLRVRAKADLKPVDISTQPFPGFPTDMQAQFMVLATRAKGQSVLIETIFENRFMHVPELQRMGADIQVEGRTVIVRGPTKLTGAQVMATDLRASASLVLAGLVAEGKTEVRRIYHLDRGYDRLDKKLRALGADVRRSKGGL